MAIETTRMRHDRTMSPGCSLSDSFFSEQIDAVTEGEEELLHPGVGVYLFVKDGYGLAVLIFRVKYPAVPQRIVDHNEAAFAQIFRNKNGIMRRTVSAALQSDFSLFSRTTQPNSL